jgi:putative toxin-antitoxin system antitoxin component (TIGR02293 family)
MATNISTHKNPSVREASFRGHSVGMKTANTAQVIKAIKKGLPYDAVIKLQKESGFPVEQIAEVVQVPLRTLARRKKAGRLAPDESERLLRFGFIFDKTLELFDGDQAAAQHWLNSPAKSFGGETPLVMLQTEIGAREVDDLLGRLEHGVFS